MDGWPGVDRGLIYLRFNTKKNDCINQFYVGFRVKVLVGLKFNSSIVKY